MGIVFKESAKDYYLLVNRPELAKRAEELGYEGVMLFTGDDFDKEDIEHMRSLVSHTKSGYPFSIPKIRKKPFCRSHYSRK